MSEKEGNVRVPGFVGGGGGKPPGRESALPTSAGLESGVLEPRTSFAPGPMDPSDEI